MNALEFLRDKGIIVGDKKQFVINYPDGTSFSINDLLEEYADQRVEEEKERLSLLYHNIPEECVQGYDEIKFCSYRNGEGERCRQCM